MEKEVSPISPKDIKIVRDIPWYIIEAVNELLQINYCHNDRLIVIREDEIIERAFEKSGLSDYKSFKMMYWNYELDLLRLYIQEGWSVTCNKGGVDLGYYFAFWDTTSFLN